MSGWLRRFTMSEAEMARRMGSLKKKTVDGADETEPDEAGSARTVEAEATSGGLPALDKPLLPHQRARQGPLAPIGTQAPTYDAQAVEAARAGYEAEKGHKFIATGEAYSEGHARSLYESGVVHMQSGESAIDSARLAAGADLSQGALRLATAVARAHRGLRELRAGTWRPGKKKRAKGLLKAFSELDLLMREISAGILSANMDRRPFRLKPSQLRAWNQEHGG